LLSVTGWWQGQSPGPSPYPTLCYQYIHSFVYSARWLKPKWQLFGQLHSPSQALSWSGWCPYSTLCSMTNIAVSPLCLVCSWEFVGDRFIKQVFVKANPSSVERSLYRNRSESLFYNRENTQAWDGICYTPVQFQRLKVYCETFQIIVVWVYYI
jgi:hypothetical protein